MERETTLFWNPNNDVTDGSEYIIQYRVRESGTEFTDQIVSKLWKDQSFLLLEIFI